MRSSRKWVTMSEVAARAKVGTITVSRVIRNPDKVKPETRKRVQAAIRELGYVPDETAGALSSNRSRMVGAVISTLEASIFASTVDGLTQSLRKAGQQLLLASSDYRPAIEAEVIATLLGRRPDGLILTSSEHKAEVEELLKSSGIPVIELWELPESPIDSAVGFSNRDAGRAITDFLLDRGHRKIGFIGGQASHDTRGRLRADGYSDALGARSLNPESILISDEGSGPDLGAAGLAKLLVQQPDTDAVVCVSDPVALGAYCEAQRRGLKIPQDLAITGFGDFELAGARGLGLTTIRIPGFEIGEKAAELILASRDTVAERGQIIDLGFELVIRQTA